MATTADFRNGMCIEFNGQLVTIVQFQHVKPGKGPAFVRTKLKNISTGRVVENTFSSGVKVTEARVEHRPHQFLYKDEMGYNLMNLETYEQFAVSETIVGTPSYCAMGRKLIWFTMSTAKHP
jgi:elongation factor P